MKTGSSSRNGPVETITEEEALEQRLMSNEGKLSKACLWDRRPSIQWINVASSMDVRPRIMMMMMTV